jgi:outer membrane protein
MRKLLTYTAAVAALIFMTTAQAWDQGDWIGRLGASNIAPDDPNGSILGLDITVDDEWGVTFNGEYMLRENWGLELLAALPYEHDIKVDTLGKVGSTKHLPPTISVNYHFLPDAKFQPYIGAGLNFTIFFDDEEDGTLKDIGGTLELEDDTSFGLAGQIGADWIINDKWFVNFNFRYIDIDTEAKVFVPDPVVPGGGTVQADVDIDPFLYGLHVGYKF